MTKPKPKPPPKRAKPRPGAKRPVAKRPKVRPARAKGQGTRDVDGLTQLERLFAVEYLVDLNATQAWHRASPKSSIVTCERNGHRALQLPALQALVQAERDKRMEAAGLSVADVLEKLRQMLMYDPRKLATEQGGPVAVQDLDDDLAAAISGVEWGAVGKKFYVKKYKMADRNSTLEKAMKYHGLFSVDNKQKADAVGALLAAVQANESRLPIKTK